MAQLTPLHKRIIDRICPEIATRCPRVEAFLTKPAGGNTDYVLVGMIEAATGDFNYVSLNRLVDDQFATGEAASRPHRAAQCLAGAVLASSAMPG